MEVTMYHTLNRLLVGDNPLLHVITHLKEESVIVGERFGILFVLGELLEFLLLIFVGSDLVQDLHQINRQLT